MIIRIIITVVVLGRLGGALIVSPVAPYIKTEGATGFFYKCENPDVNGPQPQWDDSEGDPIYSTSGGGSNRVYTTAVTSSTECSDSSSLCKFTRLHFRDVQKEDSGLYACKADGHLTITRTITVVEEITFPLWEEEEEQSLIHNTTSTIYCSARPLNVGLSMFWEKDSGSVGSTEKYQTQTFGQLTVNNVRVQDEGTYTCTAHYNTIGVSQAKDIRVTVQVPPSWDGVPPRPRNVVINSDVTLVCSADGRPDPAVSWVDVTTGLRSNITHTPGVYELSGVGNRQLTIRDIQLPDQGNIYRIECTASNDPPEPKFSTAITHTIQLTVLLPPVLNNQVNLTVRETALNPQTATFECANTQARAEATLSFRRDGRDIMDILDIGVQPDDARVTVTRNVVTGSLTVTITNVQREHEGIWTCYAESSAGDVYVDHFLLVEYVPVIDQSRTPDRTVSWEGNPTNLSCTYFGYPTPTIWWYKNTHRLNETDNIKFVTKLPAGTSIVTILSPRVEDFGAYFCEGRNSEGNIRYRQELVKAGRPSQPLGLTIFDVTSSTFTVRFFPPSDNGELHILGYTLQYWVANDRAPMEIPYENPQSEADLCLNILTPVLTGNEQECFNYCEDTSKVCCPTGTRQLCLDRPENQNFIEIRLTNLRALSSYTVRAAARNELGVGDFTTNVTENTDDFSRPDEPIIISRPVSDYGDRYILRWEPPLNDGGFDIFRYNIRFSQVESKYAEALGPRPVPATTKGTERQLEIFPLNRGQYYRIELRAENSIGESLPVTINIETAGVFTFLTTPPMRPTNKGFWGLFNENTTVIIVVLIIVLFIAFLIVTDVCCFCVNDCGLLMFICVTCCGKTPPSTKEEIEVAETEFGGDSLKDWESYEDKM